MAYSGQETLRILMIGSYKYDVSIRGLKLRKFSRSAGAQTELVGRIANPDLMRHYAFIDIRSSDLSYHNVIKSLEHIPSDYISVLIKYCDTCGKHFMQTWYCRTIVGSHDLTCHQCHQCYLMITYHLTNALHNLRFRFKINIIWTNTSTRHPEFKLNDVSKGESTY